MIRIRQGSVLGILSARPGVTEIMVEVEGDQARAVNYDQLTGPVNKGDRVILNTTAIAKGLGTGGNHFVMANLAREKVDAPEEGHIMKLRYTPEQVKCLAVEEQDSPYHQTIKDFQNLAKMPVVVGTLHSMLAPAAAAVKLTDNRLKVAYIMTDGAALPYQFSKLAAELRDKKLIDSSVTVGHAFGGDYEAVNIYTGLVAAKEIIGADVAIVAMGPGIVGTGTEYGFTGIEQGEIINAVNILGGQPVAIPRISFADSRKRHFGVSHHTLTALGKIALTPSRVVIPEMEPEKRSLIEEQLCSAGIKEKHQVLDRSAEEVLDALKDKYQIGLTTMGRTVDQDREFFLAAAAAGLTAADLALGIKVGTP